QTVYRAVLVPRLWLWTRLAQSRIFQELSVPDILQKVLGEYGGLKMNFLAKRSDFPPRNYCVQYRETDFNFLSRLMEEEGLYYYFSHDEDDHTLVIGNTPQGHLPLPAPQGPVLFEETQGVARQEFHIQKWEKVQEFRAPSYFLLDYSFQMPDNRLAAEKPGQPSVQVGEREHPLPPYGAPTEDFPAGVTKRFDGISPGGSDRPKELEKVFPDLERTAAVRM